MFISSWFWFTAGSTVSAIMAIVLTAVTLEQKNKHGFTLVSWVVAVCAYFAFVYLGMTYLSSFWYSYLVFFGWLIFLLPPALLLYKGSVSTRLFTITSSVFLANVTTFMSGGITTVLIVADCYDLETGYLWSIPFTIVKLIISVITVLLYYFFLKNTVAEVFKVLEGKMSRFVPVPFIASIGFFFLSQTVQTYGLMPDKGFDFILFYAILCLVFAVMYQLVFSNVLWTSRAMRTQAELNVASKIQKDMLPCIFPPFPERAEFDIYATMLPAKEVGGDFYDFFLIDDTHLGLVIADVSGKGVPAALFMVIAKTLIKNYAQMGMSASEVFMKANNQLCEGNEAGMFVTAFMGILDLKTGEFQYVNAGHNPPCIKKANGDFEFVKIKAGFVLAGMEGVKYREGSVKFDQGDTIYLYTDGVTEATDINNELFSEPRLISSLNKYKNGSLQDLLTEVKNDIDKFVDKAPQFDDITMLAVTYEGGIK